MFSKKIGLYFGTFNPIHIGHLTIANHIAEFSDVDEVWLVVTPLSPFKKKSTMLPSYDRFEMALQATQAYEKIKPSDIEFNLPQPNYTTNTLAYLEEKHPNYSFVLIMGEDNLYSLPKWKNSEVLLNNYEILVYPRITIHKEKSLLAKHPAVKFIDAPIMEISSSFIRKCIKEGKNVRPMLAPEVSVYIEKMNFYK